MFTNRPAKNIRTTASPDGKPIAQAAVPAEAYRIRDLVQRKLISESEGSDVNLSNQPQMRQMIETLFNQVLAEENMLYTRAARGADPGLGAGGYPGVWTLGTSAGR